MNFIHPLGLLGLIGIPVLIIVYIIKNKYTEQTVSSTYLWTLSEKFIKRKNPISKITGIISLILQILAVLLVSLALARPYIVLADAANEYCFILDGSGSMNIMQNGETRFDRAKSRISSIIDQSMDGSVYSFVYIGNGEPEEFRRIEEKADAKKQLSLLEAAYVATDSETVASALGIAQGYFNQNNSIITYLVTDKDYQIHENVNVINVSGGEQNYAVSDVEYELDGGILSVSGNAISYESDAALTLCLYIDGASDAAGTVSVNAVKGEKQQFYFECAVESFTSFKVNIENSDALALDNEVVVYNVSYENAYTALIVSDNPFFISSALSAVSEAQITVVSTEKYKPADGYDLYLFDSYKPEALPSDGTVWLMNVNGSIENSGFTVRGTVDIEGDAIPQYSTSSSSTVKALQQDLLKEEFYISRYIKCGLYGNFTTVLSYEGNPLVFTGLSSSGNREVVFAFDIHDSNFPLKLDFVLLVRNLIRFSFPEVISEVLYECGDSAPVSVIPNCESIRVVSPSGSVQYLNVANAVNNLTLYEVGTYGISVTASGNTREYFLHSALPESERVTTAFEQQFSIQGEAGSDGYDSKFDLLYILLICLGVILLADWAVYCYEQYQLR